MVGKGTPSFGSRGKASNHIPCRRCGRHSYHVSKKECSACGFGSHRKLQTYKWQWKTIQRKRRK